MEKRPTVCILLAVLVLFQNVGSATSQDIGSLLGPTLNDNREFARILNFVFQTVVMKADTLDLLRETVNYTLPLVQYDQPGVVLTVILPWAFKNLPWLVGTPEFQSIAALLIRETNAHSDLLNLPGFSRIENGVQTVDVAKYLSYLNYPGLIGDIKDGLFPFDNATRELDPQCYSDVMTFIDKLLVFDKDAVNMFDAVGKPTMGINKGVLYFMGSYDECLAVHAVPRDVNGTRDPSDQYDFKGRYCRATFDPPRSLIEVVAGEHINETHGLDLTLSWGMCLPDSCSAGDIEGLLNLGLLGDWFNITVKEAHCSEDQMLAEDKKAQIVLGILGGLTALVIICSVLDILFFKPKPQDVKGIMRKYALSDIPMYDNMAFGEDQPEPPTRGQMEMTKPEENDGETESEKPVDMKPVSESGLSSNGFYAPGQQAYLDITLDSDLTSHRGDNFVQQGRLVSLIRGFSVFTNIPTLMDSETKSGDIPCLYGIRVVTMAFIVLANTFLYTVLSVSEVPVAVNLMDSFAFMDRWTFQPILQASLNTDTFFVISGCLTGYWFLVRAKSLERKVNGLMWLKFYLGRYWKMTPPYMLVMILFVYLYMYLGQGPMWPDRMNVADKCQTDWWKHLLYISNVVDVEGVPAEDQCMPWSWYLAVNMQFYLIAPIFLSLLVYSSSMGLILLLIIGTAGVISAGVKESEYGGDLLTTRTDNGAYWNNVFIAPWCRVAPFCIGMVLGFLIFRRRTIGKPLQKWIAAICWAGALLLGALILYCQYTKYVDSVAPWDLTQNSAFEALSRPVWALGVGWVIYACCEGYAGPFGDFFSWRGFVPLSRMTFMVYLLHPIVIVLFTYSRRSLVYIRDFDMIYLYIGHLVISYAGAFLACLVFDLPFRNIRRAIQGKPVDTPY